MKKFDKRAFKKKAIKKENKRNKRRLEKLESQEFKKITGIDSRAIFKEHQAIIRENIKKALRQRESDLKTLANMSPDQRLNARHATISKYELDKRKEYETALKAIKKNYPNYYNYYKEYEKKHGWKKTTQLLNKSNIMRKHIDYYSTNKPRFKQIKDKKTPEKPVLTEKQKKILEKQFTEYKPPKIKEPEHLKKPVDAVDLLSDEEIYQQLVREQIEREKILADREGSQASRYIRYRLLRVGYNDYLINKLLSKLTAQEIIEIASRLQHEVPIDENDVIGTPDYDKPEDFSIAMQDILNEEHLRINEIIEEYEVFI